MSDGFILLANSAMLSYTSNLMPFSSKNADVMEINGIVVDTGLYHCAIPYPPHHIYTVLVCICMLYMYVCAVWRSAQTLGQPIRLRWPTDGRWISSENNGGRKNYSHDITQETTTSHHIKQWVCWKLLVQMNMSVVAHWICCLCVHERVKTWYHLCATAFTIVNV